MFTFISDDSDMSPPGDARVKIMETWMRASDAVESCLSKLF